MDGGKCDAYYMVHSAASVLAELSGWFTNLWGPLVACGMLGMYMVAEELRYQYGTGWKGSTTGTNGPDERKKGMA